MYEKLDRLREEVRRAEKRKESADKKLKEAQERLQEAENSQILADVGALNYTPEQVALFLRMAASGKLPKVNPDGSFEDETAKTADTVPDPEGNDQEKNAAADEADEINPAQDTGHDDLEIYGSASEEKEGIWE